MGIQIDKNKLFSNILNIQDIDILNKSLDDEITRKKTKEQEDKIDKQMLIQAAAFAISRDALEITPIKTGKLRDSLKMQKIRQGYKIWYDCEYATHVHEIPFYTHEHPTQYKFLEDTAIKISNQYLSYYGIDLGIKITYDPLAIYIGINKAPGELLVDVHAKEQLNKTEDAYKALLNHLDVFETGNIKPEEEPYYVALYNYMIWWGGYRNKSTEDVIKSWLERTRHNLVDLNYTHKWHW